MRNESRNDRLLALEKQIKVLSSSKSCDESTGSPSNSNDPMSDRPIADSLILIRRLPGVRIIILNVINSDCFRNVRSLFH